MTKPFNLKVLLAHIRALSRREGEPQETILQCGNLSLNHQTGSIKVGEKELRLANKELQILELLMKKNGNIVSVECILSSAWEATDYSTEGNVYVFISYLRKKLKEIGADVEIKAYRHQGYALEKLS